MPKHSSIYLFSKTSYPDVNHVPILTPTYLQPTINFLSYDYIIATSKETITALNKIGNWKDLPVLAISESTADYVKSQGGKVLDIADGYGKSIVTLVEKKYSNLKVLHPHAKVIAFDIEGVLRKKNIKIDSFVVYKTSCSKEEKVELPSDAICIFTSPSSVNCFLQKYTFLPTYKIVCIGETTASELPKDLVYVLSEKTSVESTILKANSL